MKPKSANKRGAGKGGFAVLWHDGRAWPALPDRERSVKSMRSIVIALSLIVLPWSWACAEVQFTNVVKASLVFREESIPSGDYPHLLRVFLCLENQHDSDVSWVCNSTEVEAEVLDRAGKPVPCPPSLSSIPSNAYGYLLPHGSRLEWLISHGGISMRGQIKEQCALIVGGRGWLLPRDSLSSYSLRLRLRGWPWTRDERITPTGGQRILFEVPPTSIVVK